MARDEDDDRPERVFSVFEANQLIPQLQSHFSQIQQGKTVLLQTRDEVRRASAQADRGGGTAVGAPPPATKPRAP